jgi:6,7-dimethyl-8-ribityllumazine synthase
MKEFSGSLEGTGLRAAIAASRYNDFVTERLKDGAVEALLECGVADNDIELFWCPGALELPMLVQRLVTQGVGGQHFDLVIAIGCVIRGDTDHYTHVATEAVRGVCDVARTHHTPLGNAILTVETIEQATERSGEKSLNKGYEAAQVALQMTNLLRSLK